MLIITGGHRSDRRGTQRSRHIHIAVAILGSLLCLHRAAAGESASFNPKPEAQAGQGVGAPNASTSGYGLNDDSRMKPKRPVLRVPATDSTPAVDGKLDEPCWKDAAKTGRADEGPWQLFDLAVDPGEKINLRGNSEHAEIQAAFEQRLHEFFAAYSDPLWNLWKPDGTSKHLHTKKRPKRP